MFRKEQGGQQPEEKELALQKWNGSHTDQASGKEGGRNHVFLTGREEDREKRASFNCTKK